MPVTRHGLQEDGVICPRCSTQAVEPGEWEKIHKRERITRDDNGAEVARWYEEGASCPTCAAFLLASPDDDIDPINAGQEYDEATYHQFNRPPDWKPPRQRTLNREPVVEEWVVVEPGVSVEINGTIRDMSNAEGRIKQINGDKARVELAGYSGIRKDDLAEFDLDQIRPMVFDRLQQGTPVRILRHPGYQGREGIVSKLPSSQSESGTIGVMIDDDGTKIEIILPIERVKQLIKE